MEPGGEMVVATQARQTSLGGGSRTVPTWTPCIGPSWWAGGLKATAQARGTTGPLIDS